MDPIEATTSTSNVETSSNNGTTPLNVSGENSVVVDKKELFRKKFLESNNCLFCQEVIHGPQIYSHYITCTNIFLKELQASFVPSSILSYCITADLLESVFQTPTYVPQLQALIAQLNTHLNTLQAPPAPAPAPVVASSKSDAKKKK